MAPGACYLYVLGYLVLTSCFKRLPSSSAAGRALCRALQYRALLTPLSRVQLTAAATPVGFGSGIRQEWIAGAAAFAVVAAFAAVVVVRRRRHAQEQQLTFYDEPTMA